MPWTFTGSRGHNFPVRLSARQRAHLDRVCAETGMSLSQAIREAVDVWMALAHGQERNDGLT